MPKKKKSSLPLKTLKLSKYQKLKNYIINHKTLTGIILTAITAAALGLSRREIVKKVNKNLPEAPKHVINELVSNLPPDISNKELTLLKGKGKYQEPVESTLLKNDKTLKIHSNEVPNQEPDLDTKCMSIFDLLQKYKHNNRSSELKYKIFELKNMLKINNCKNSGYSEIYKYELQTYENELQQNLHFGKRTFKRILKYDLNILKKTFKNVKKIN